MHNKNIKPTLKGNIVFALVHKTEKSLSGKAFFVGGLRTAFYPIRIFKTFLPEQIKHFQSFSRAKAFLGRVDIKNVDCKNYERVLNQYDVVKIRLSVEIVKE